MTDDNVIEVTTEEGTVLRLHYAGDGMVMEFPDSSKVHLNKEQTATFIAAIEHCHASGKSMTINIHGGH